METEVGVMQLQVKECQGLPAATRSWKRQGTDPSLEPPEGTVHAITLILTLWDSFLILGLQNYKIFKNSVVLSPYICSGDLL